MSLLNYFRRKQSNQDAADDNREVQVQDRGNVVEHVALEPTASASTERSQKRTNVTSPPDVAVSSSRPKPMPTGQLAASAALATTKHARSFNPKWRDGRAWLKYTEGLGMFCEFCQEFNKRPFDRDTWNLVPCKRLRLESINDHEKCQAHKDALKCKAESKKHEHIGLAVFPSVNKNDMTKTFACLYFLCKQRIAHTTNFEPLLDFIGYLGQNLKEKIFVGRNAHYTSRKSIQEMLKCMSDVIETDILAEVKSSRHYSLQFDETTDCSVKEQMTLRTRYISANTGDIKVRFLKIIDCLSGNEQVTLSAATIADVVMKCIESQDLQYSRLRGLGTDGAAVMTGQRSGAVRRIRDKQLEAQEGQSHKCEAVGCHCAAHKLSLAAEQAGNGEYMKKFKDNVRKLYDFYDNSAVRSAGLAAVQRLLEQPVRKVIEPSSTRWLSMGNSVMRLKEILPSVICSLGRESEERGDPTATGLYHFLSHYQFIATMLLLCDVLPIVNILSKVFQSTDLDFAKATKLKDTTLNEIKSLLTDDGSNLKDIRGYIEKLEEADIKVTYQRGLRSDVSTVGDANARFVQNVKQPFLEKLITNIENRFQDSDILMAFSAVFDPSKLDMDSVSYGDAEVQLLVDRFGCTGSDNALTAEWHMFRRYQNEHLTSLHMGEVVEKLCTDNDLGRVFPVMSYLAGCFRALPPHTADCERDFSQMKLIKSVLRNRMSETTLDCLMRIVIEGPSIPEFQFHKAVEMWASRTNRRLKLN